MRMPPFYSVFTLHGSSKYLYVNCYEQHAGIRTPLAIQDMAEKLPEAFQALSDHLEKLEVHMKDMQDTEFTVQVRYGARLLDSDLQSRLDLQPALPINAIVYHIQGTPSIDADSYQKFDNKSFRF